MFYLLLLSLLINHISATNPPDYTKWPMIPLESQTDPNPIPEPTNNINKNNHHRHRRLLHLPLHLSEPPSPSPLNQYSHTSLPFSSTSAPPPDSDDDSGLPFFPTITSPPPSQPPLPPQPTTTATFPANVSSLSLPTTSQPHSHSNNSAKGLIIAAVVTVVVFSAIIFIIVLRKRSTRSSSEKRPLYPSNTPTSDGGPPPTKTFNNGHVSHTSSEFLYLGTVAETNEFQVRPTIPIEITTSATSSEKSEKIHHLKLCGTGSSPELRPLPPLPKHSGSFHLTRSCEHNFRVDSEGGGGVQCSKGEEHFFSPTNSSPPRVGDEDDFSNNYGLKSCFSSSFNDNDSPRNSGLNVDNLESPSDSDVSIEIQSLGEKAEYYPAPPPPPGPPAQVVRAGGGPPTLVPPSGPVVMKRSENLSKSGEMMKPKLKALYWDKVRASSDRVTVWDQLHPGSFKLNEEMIETLFTAKDGGGGGGGVRRSMLTSLNEEYRVLDPKKSQNIAILLKALSVTEKEVCEALLEGNADVLGTELLESLLKMAPTKEEERKLVEYNDETPVKLGPAEKFLRAVVDVPFAFKRVDAMLYMTTFDSEVEYLTKAFETLEAAGEQLRNSRIFLNLLEAVLKTGNRMNIGTNRGDAQAFKLDTLLKLVDIKGRDGKTTLLHFVVQEIIKAEGTRTRTRNPQTGPDPKPVTIPDDIESRKRGLEIVTSLGGELVNVKKAAGMDSDSLSKDVMKLSRDITKINEILTLNEENQMVENNTRFTDSIKGFLNKAEVEIALVQSRESKAFGKVKELTEYFHGNSSKEEAHPFRVFTVVRDFLGVLDQVCKEVGKVNERTIMSSVRQLPGSVNPVLLSPFPEFSKTGNEDGKLNESVVKV